MAVPDPASHPLMTAHKPEVGKGFFFFFFISQKADLPFRLLGGKGSKDPPSLQGAWKRASSICSLPHGGGGGCASEQEGGGAGFE